MTPIDLGAPISHRVLFLLSFILTYIAIVRLWLTHAATKDTTGHIHLDNLVESAFIALVITVVLNGWVGVILATLSSFSILGLAGVLLPFVIAYFWLTRSQPKLRTSIRVDSQTFIIVGIILLCCILYLRPHEYLLGGSDAGSYMNISAQLAKTGEFIVYDEWLEVLTDYAPVTLREQPSRWKTQYLQFVGWYIGDQDARRLIPQFFPMHPVLLAIGTSLAGLRGGLYVTPIWGVLDVLAVYFLAKQLFNRHTATLGAILFAVNPLQVWFARYPTTEPLTLLLIFTGLLTWQKLWDHTAHGDECQQASLLWGITSGAAFGAAWLTRIDLPVILALIVGFLLLRRLRDEWHKGFTAFTITLLVFTLHATWSALTINWPYTWNTYSSVWNMLKPTLGWLGPIIIAFISILMLIYLDQRKRNAKLQNVLKQRLPRTIRLIAIIGIIALSSYAYFIRPHMEPIVYSKSWPMETPFPNLNGQNWVRMGWYLTPLGILLGTLGVAVLLYRASLYRIGLYLSAGVITTVQYVYNIFNMHYHIYAMRRYVPIVIPVLIICMAVTLHTMWKARYYPIIMRVISGTLSLVLLGALLYQSRFVLPHRDFYGLLGQLNDLNAALKPNAIVVIAEETQAAFADQFGAPLRFIFDHKIATVRNDTALAHEALEAILDYAAFHDYPVQLIAANPIPKSVRYALKLEPQTMVSLSFPALESTYFSYPSQIMLAHYGIDIYNIQDYQLEEARTVPPLIDIDIGRLDTQYIVDGFHEVETFADNVTLRWTTELATLNFAAQEGPVTIKVRARSYRPPGIEPANVIMSLDGQKVGEFLPKTNDWSVFTFESKADPISGISKLQLETGTFNPADFGLNSDERHLGIMLDWITIQK